MLCSHGEIPGALKSHVGAINDVEFSLSDIFSQRHHSIVPSGDVLHLYQHIRPCTLFGEEHVGVHDTWRQVALPKLVTYPSVARLLHICKQISCFRLVRESFLIV